MLKGEKEKRSEHSHEVHPTMKKKPHKKKKQKVTDFQVLMKSKETKKTLLIPRQKRLRKDMKGH